MVNELRDQFLACAALTVDKDVRIARCNSPAALDHILESFALADKLDSACLPVRFCRKQFVIDGEILPLDSAKDCLLDLFDIIRFAEYFVCAEPRAFDRHLEVGELRKNNDL